MEINGITVGTTTKDLTGLVVGKLTVSRLVDKVGKHYRWSCICECGNTKVAKGRELRIGDTKSCGCQSRNSCEAFAEKHRTHGMTGTPEYKAWKRIKGRCLNPNSSEYQKYSKIGVSEDIAYNFENFLLEIGEIPKDLLLTRVSVDRIDNNLGYVEGNMRWATDEDQSRNKGKYKNNKSGVTGVRFFTGATGLEYWTASYNLEKGKNKTKYFSVNKLGSDGAFKLACQFREDRMEGLKALGYGYTENHGK